MEAFSLDGEVALITGGGTGLGHAMAVRFAEAGARVVVAGRRAEPLQDTVAAIGDLARYEIHDVADTSAARALIERIYSKEGKLSILINNAGSHVKKPVVEVSDDDWQQMMGVHLTGAFALSRAAAPRMLAAQHGSILYISSMAALIGLPLVAPYSAAKAGVVGLVRAMASEFGSQGVRVNGIAPGWIETDMARGALNGDPARREKILSRTPLKRFGTVEDVAYAALYLCSPAARFVTGTMLTVDGGASIGF